MDSRVRVVGSYLSPYVRKVLAALHLKGVSYEIDPLIPFFGDDRFSALSPLRCIPVLIDGELSLCDSTVICEYIEERWPSPALLPRGIADRARARWLEEYADTRLGDVLIWRLFDPLVITPGVWREAPRHEQAEHTRSVEIPPVLDWLERQLPEQGTLFGSLSLADLAIATFFRNAAMAGYRVDAERWPRTAAFVARVLALDCFARLVPFEERMLRTPPPRHRAALAELGAPLSADTFHSATPRRGLSRAT